MNQLTKEKRNQLIMVTLGTLTIIAGLWLLPINAQRSKLDRISVTIRAAQQKLNTMQKAVDGSSKFDAELKDAVGKLNAIEEEMSTGDHFSWIIEAIRRFKLGHNVDIPQFSPVVKGEVTLFPKFPYQQAMLGVSGTAYYYDFGKFLADFENRFPYMRVQNIELEPAPTLLLPDKEKLSFRMEIVMLVKPTF